MKLLDMIKEQLNWKDLSEAEAQQVIDFQMQRPCEPSDVNWENVSISQTNKYCRVTFFLLLLSVALYGTYMQ